MTSAANHRQPLSGNNVSLHTDEHYMQRALHLAAQAEQLGEVPVGCVIVLEDDILIDPNCDANRAILGVDINLV